MEIGDLMDIQSTGKIQQRFRGIDVNDLKAAKNQVTCNMLFSNETDDTLEELATTLNTVMGVTAPSPSNSDCELSRKYIHPSTSSDVCATRRRHQLSLGHIRGSSGGGFEISFHYDNPNKKLSCRVLAAQEANEMIQGRLDGGTKLDIPWGDLFSNIRDGFLKVVKVLATSVVGGVKAVIDLTVNGVPRFWDGIIRYVRQAFDVAGAAFAHVHCQFSDLFGWLAYILDWDDIKNSAGVFKGYLKDFKTSCSVRIFITSTQYFFLIPPYRCR
jgi:hypothetical protein